MYQQIGVRKVRIMVEAWNCYLHQRRLSHPLESFSHVPIQFHLSNLHPMNLCTVGNFSWIRYIWTIGILLRRGICGSFFLSFSRSQVVMKKSSNDTLFRSKNSALKLCKNNMNQKGKDIKKDFHFFSTV